MKSFFSIIFIMNCPKSPKFLFNSDDKNAHALHRRIEKQRTSIQEMPNINLTDPLWQLYKLSQC